MSQNKMFGTKSMGKVSFYLLIPLKNTIKFGVFIDL